MTALYDEFLEETYKMYLHFQSLPDTEVVQVRWLKYLFVEDKAHLSYIVNTMVKGTAHLKQHSY